MPLSEEQCAAMLESLSEQRDPYGLLRLELRCWLASQSITSDNIDEVRRRCFMPFATCWNAIVRDETAALENKAPTSDLFPKADGI